MPRGDKPTTLALALKDGWIYEDTLPPTITKEQYDWWYKESLVLDGVRMGPPLASNKQTENQVALQPPELLPCPSPSCNSIRVKPSSDFASFYVYCLDCLMKGPRESVDSWGAKWNALPRARVRDGGVATVDHGTLKKRARQIIEAVVNSPCIVETRFFSQPTAQDLLEDQVAALLIIVATAPIAAPAKSSSDAWQRWFERLGDKASAEVVNATADLVTDERLAALVDAKVLPSIAAPQDEQDAERDQAFREFWRECEQAVPHHPSRAAEFATFTKRYKAPAPSATTNTAPSFVEEFTQAAIQAHIGFKHETRWDECDISSCSERRTMIESLRAAPSSQSLAIKAAEEIREWLGITGLVDGNGIKEVAAIIQKHYEVETKKA